MTIFTAFFPTKEWENLEIIELIQLLLIPLFRCTHCRLSDGFDTYTSFLKMKLRKENCNILVDQDLVANRVFAPR